MHEDTLEQLTEPGAKDAESFGKQLGDIYSNLLPEDHNEAFRYGGLCKRDDIRAPLTHTVLLRPPECTPRLHRAISILHTPSFMGCSLVALLAIRLA